MLGDALSWRRALARQALSDLRAYTHLINFPDQCQRLHLLQMACEKACKAYLSATGRPVLRTHAVVEKYIPLLVRTMAHSGVISGNEMKAFRRLAREIELLAPGCDASGSRPDNTEYPWKDAQGVVHAPCEYSFPNFDDTERLLVPLLRYVRLAAEQYAQ